VDNPCFRVTVIVRVGKWMSMEREIDRERGANASRKATKRVTLVGRV
jgi:hypothetical protein